VLHDNAVALPEARLAWPRQGIVADFSDVLSAINVPMLVLAREHDKVDPPQVLREHLLPLIPTARFTELRGTGHLSPLEVPDQVAAQVTDFLGTLEGRR
jgi:pimeloyl-ACP methyl ester carboxylesterase